MPGSASLSTSSLLAVSSLFSEDNPVMLPPGCDKLARPVATGSACEAETMGIVFVAWRAGSTTVELPAKITSTRIPTSSAANWQLINDGGPAKFKADIVPIDPSMVLQ